VAWVLGNRDTAAFTKSPKMLNVGMEEVLCLNQTNIMKGFSDIHLHVLQQAYKMKPIPRITLGQDATFIPTETEGL
jgi:hypothetical protein